VPNDSSTGGYLAPNTTPVVKQDTALAVVLQAMFVGLTGLDKDTGVRPSFQIKAPPQPPDAATDWMAFGVTNMPSDDEPYQEPLEDGSGIKFVRQQNFEVLCTFYGANAQGTAERVRDGLHIAQNREAIYSAGIALVSVGQPLRAPEQLAVGWRDRWDLRLAMRREEVREYPVLSFESAGAHIVGNRAETTIERDVAVSED